MYTNRIYTARTPRPVTDPQLKYVHDLRVETYNLHKELAQLGGDPKIIASFDDDLYAMVTNTGDVRDFEHASSLIDGTKSTNQRLRMKVRETRAAKQAAMDNDDAAMNRMVQEAEKAEDKRVAADKARRDDAIQRTNDRTRGGKFDPQTLEIGIYRLGDNVYKVKMNQDKTRKYAEILNYNVVAIKRLTEAGTEIKAKYVYDRGAIYNLRPEHKLTVENAEELSIVFTFCIVCGTHLKAAKSVARGIGPVCAKKV